MSNQITAPKPAPAAVIWPHWAESLLEKTQTADCYRGWQLRWPIIENAPPPAQIEAIAFAMGRAVQAGSPPKAVAVLVGRLLLHYRAADLSEGEAELVMEDWIDDLSQYPPQAIAAACREWRQTQRWRPTISELRELCGNHRRRFKREANWLLLIAAARRAGADTVRKLSLASEYSAESAASFLARTFHASRPDYDRLCALAHRYEATPTHQHADHRQIKRDIYKIISDLRAREAIGGVINGKKAEEKKDEAELAEIYKRNSESGLSL